MTFGTFLLTETKAYDKMFTRDVNSLFFLKGESQKTKRRCEQL